MSVVAKIQEERRLKAEKALNAATKTARAMATLAYVFREASQDIYSLEKDGHDATASVDFSSTSRGVSLRFESRWVHASWKYGEEAIQMICRHSDRKLDPVPLPDNGHIIDVAKNIAATMMELLVE